MIFHRSRVSLVSGRLSGGASLTAALFMALAGMSASAQANPERQWSHKDWHAEYKDGHCAISTGGDGSGWFRIELEKGGLNGSASYLPIVYSSEPLPLREDDEYALIIDHSVTAFGEEMSYYDGPDPYGRFMVGTALTGGFFPIWSPHCGRGATSPCGSSIVARRNASLTISRYPALPRPISRSHNGATSIRIICFGLDGSGYRAGHNNRDRT